MEKNIFILDSNFRHEPALADWLSEAPNYVALSDFAAVEMFKGNEPRSVIWATELLSNYPNKILILKSTPSILRISIIDKGLRRRLIDHPGTRNFPNFLRDVRNIHDDEIFQQLLQRQTWANEHQARVRSGMENYADAVREIARTFSSNERKHLRDLEPYPKDLGIKILDTVCQITENVYRRIHPSSKMFNGPIQNTYHFRYSLCTFLLVLRTIADGANVTQDIDKIVNNDYDMTYCAYATYFDGIFSKDKNVNRIYLEASLIINGIKHAVRNM